jgi:hypothetical protein
MNYLISLLLFAVLHTTLFSQIPIIKLTNAGPVLQKITDGLGDHFANYKGAPTAISSQSKEYTSTLCWTGAEKCLITEYIPLKGIENNLGSCSWQAFLPSVESFKTAEKEYKKIYHQIQNSRLQYQGKSIVLKAGYEAPTEDIGFHTILFEPKEQTRLKIELQIANTAMEWQVRISVYETEEKPEE